MICVIHSGSQCTAFSFFSYLNLYLPVRPPLFVREKAEADNRSNDDLPSPFVHFALFGFALFCHWSVCWESVSFLWFALIVSLCEYHHRFLLDCQPVRLPRWKLCITCLFVASIVINRSIRRVSNEAAELLHGLSAGCLIVVRVTELDFNAYSG